MAKSETEVINELRLILESVQKQIDDSYRWAYQWCDEDLFIEYVLHDIDDKYYDKCQKFFVKHFDEICIIINMLTGISVNEIDGHKYFLFGRCTEEQVRDELKEIMYGENE